MTHRETSSSPPHPDDTPLQRFGAMLRQCRQQRRLSQSALAATTGIRPSYISQIELGKRNITVLTLLRLARALGIPSAWLLIHVNPHDILAPPRTDDPLPTRGDPKAGATQDTPYAALPDDPALLLARLGTAIRQARQQRHLSQQLLAARTGLSPTYIVEIEQGHRNLSVLSLSRIAETLEITAADLLAQLDTSQHSSSLPTE